MYLRELLSPERILVDPSGARVRSKAEALRSLAELLAPTAGVEADEVLRQLLEREELQSTGIGEGVAIPHTCVDTAGAQAGALVLCAPVPFDAIDGAPVGIVFGVIGPRRATGDHLRALARISRLLRNAETRRELLAARDSGVVWDIVNAHEETPA